jgi:hypothetical protein
MNNVAATLRNLDSLFYEDYAISELNPIVGHSTYQNQINNYGMATSSKNLEKDLPASSFIVNNDLLDYSYEPKYILDVDTLDTTYLLAYMQSLQDLFLITNDITAGNEILNTTTYNVINEALNVKNSAGLANIANLNLSVEQNYIFAECSIGINALLTSIANSSGFIDAELNSITNLRENYYKNIEALNIKYITILNIIDSRIVQIQNLEQLIERLNNQLLMIANSNINVNPISNYINNNNLDNANLNNNIINNNYNDQNNNSPNYDNYNTANNYDNLDNNYNNINSNYYNTTMPPLNLDNNATNNKEENLSNELTNPYPSIEPILNQDNNQNYESYLQKNKII